MQAIKEWARKAKEDFKPSGKAAPRGHGDGRATVKHADRRTRRQRTRAAAMRKELDNA